jgi:hypothetical protein
MITLHEYLIGTLTQHNRGAAIIGFHSEFLFSVSGFLGLVQVEAGEPGIGKRAQTIRTESSRSMDRDYGFTSKLIAI